MHHLIFAFIFSALLIILLIFGAGNVANAEFKPLTRDEPVVRMVLQEAAYEPFVGLVAVAGVALDRVTDKRWPATERGVIYQPRQFTGMSIPLRNYAPVTIERARRAVEWAREGVRPCGTVLWYHTYEVFPEWRKRLAFKCLLGAHIFYGDR